MKESILFKNGRSTSCMRILCVLLLTAVANPRSLGAQASSPTGQTSTVDAQTLQTLLQRMDRLEARVRQLESERVPAKGESAFTEAAKSTPSVASAPAVPPLTPPAPSTPLGEPMPSGSAQEREAEPSEHVETERMDLSKTLLRVRGFGDVTLHGDNFHPPNLPGDKTTFTLGQLNLFVTSDISDRFKFLGEIVFEAGPDNIYGQIRPENTNSFGVDVERYLLTYSYNNYFNISAGRYHTAIGYYNTAYHHSTWLQTTTGRPFLFAFEDQGGILPIHNVGVEAYGLIPSGSVGLHYVAEVGNGRESRSPIAEEPVQNIISDKNHKAVNFELFARPLKFPGLQAGFSVYHDLLVPFAQAPVGETILAAHAVYSKTNFEWLNEALVVRHTPEGGHTFQTPGFYSQISERFGSYRPYFRYQYVNASSQEPIFPDVGLRAGPSVGLRYDASESVALKLQYDFTSLRDQRSVQGAQAQIGFTF